MTSDAPVVEAGSGNVHNEQCACDAREHLTVLAEQVARLWEAIEGGHRLAMLDETVQGVVRRLAEIGQRLAAFADDAARLWEAVETDRVEAARRLHRIDRLEGAFESQWSVLRRLELNVLELQTQVKLMRQQLAVASASAGG